MYASADTGNVADRQVDLRIEMDCGRVAILTVYLDGSDGDVRRAVADARAIAKRINGVPVRRMLERSA